MNVYPEIAAAYGRQKTRTKTSPIAFNLSAAGYGWQERLVFWPRPTNGKQRFFKK